MQWSIAIVITRINGEHVLVEEVREELVACEIDCMKGSLKWRLWMRIAGERDERVKAFPPSLFLSLSSFFLNDFYLQACLSNSLLSFTALQDSETTSIFSLLLISFPSFFRSFHGDDLCIGTAKGAIGDASAPVTYRASGNWFLILVFGLRI